MSQLLQDKYKVTVPRDAWALDKLPDHLNVRYSVIDEKGNEIKNSRDINLLQKELADTINTSALDKIRGDWEKEGITRWDFGELPRADSSHRYSRSYRLCLSGSACNG